MQIAGRRLGKGFTKPGILAKKRTAKKKQTNPGVRPNEKQINAAGLRRHGCVLFRGYQGLPAGLIVQIGEERIDT